MLTYYDLYSIYIGIMQKSFIESSFSCSLNTSLYRTFNLQKYSLLPFLFLFRIVYFSKLMLKSISENKLLCYFGQFLSHIVILDFLRGKRRCPLLGLSAKKVTDTGESPVKGQHGDQGARVLGIEAKFQFPQPCKDIAKGASYL